VFGTYFAKHRRELYTRLTLNSDSTFQIGSYGLKGWDSLKGNYYSRRDTILLEPFTADVNRILNTDLYVHQGKWLQFIQLDRNGPNLRKK